MLVTHTDSARHRALAITAMLLAGILGALYLAGYFFLIKLNNAALQPHLATPYTVIAYWRAYGDDPYTRRWLTGCLLAAAVPIVVVLAVLLAPVKRSLHGDARFATRRELDRADVFADQGLILGRWGSRFIMLGKQMAALCAAPPRSGKGAGLVQPNALSWTGSFVVHDLRKECWRITAGWRSTFSDTYLFDPLAEDGRTAQWNPLSYVRDEPALRINDLQKLGNMLSPDPASGDPFWPASCRDLLTGLGLYVLETPALPRTLGEVMRQIMHGAVDSVSEHWRTLIERRDASANPLSPTCKALLYDFINLSPPTQSSVRKTFTAKLQLWANPLIDAATSGDSFDLRALRRRRISIYVGVNPGDLGRLSLLLNLFFTQMFDANMDKMPEEDPELKHELLPMMDEFTALGRMPIFSDAISSMGGYGIRAFVIVQAFAQLRAVYGPDLAEAIATCCGGMVVFAPREQKYAEDISRMLGNLTAKAKSRSHQILSGKLGTVSTSAAARPLLNPHEVKQIGKGNEIIFIEGTLPILCKKIWYWKLRVFRRRANLTLPVITPISVTMPMPLPSAAQAVTAPSTGVPTIDPAKQQRPRPIKPVDVPKLATLSLTSYAVNFDKVVLPKGEPVTDNDLRQAFGSFLKTIESSKEQ